MANLRKQADVPKTKPRVTLLRAGRNDPDVVRRVIEQGEMIYQSCQAAPTRAPLAHEPVVYYFALGDLVKIGTSQNIARRAEAFNPQEILAVERGGFEQERERHELFAPLLVHGEWFRHEDPLLSYIETTRAAFEGDFGMPMDQWLRERRVILPRVVMQDRE